ncbi:Replication factor C small subunit [uncultured archaeon]|nr:Replication factor C small subunit [uncultured archaeon]
MAKVKEEAAQEEGKPRPVAGDERVEITEVDPQETDIFDEVLHGQKRQKAESMRRIIEKNEKELAGAKEEEDGDGKADVAYEDSDEEYDDEDDEDGEDDDEDGDNEKPGDVKASGREEDETGKAVEEAEEEIEGKTAGAKRGKAAEDEADDEEGGTADEDDDAAEEETPEPKRARKQGNKKQIAKKAMEEAEETEEPEAAESGESGDEGEEDGFNDWDEAAFDTDYDSKEPEELKAPVAVQNVPGKDEIRRTILQKAADADDELGQYDQSAEKLSFLSDPAKKSVFIGRKASLMKRYGFEAALHLGRVQEKEFENNEVFLDSLNPHVVFVCGARGSGKCLTGDTLITLESGEVIPIKELENRDEKVFAINHGLKVEATPRTEFFKRTVNKTLKVKMQSGKEIELTPEHPLLTINGWLPAEELGPRDRIATPRLLPAFGLKKMKECDVKLLAYLIAEGHLSNQFVLFSNFDEKIVNDFNASIEAFDQNLRIEQHSKPGCFRIAQKKKKINLGNVVRNEKGQFTDKGFIRAERSSIMQWLEGIGLYGKLSAEKFIPTEVMQLEKQQLALFLNRLFSCDGSIYRVNRGKNWAVSIGFASEKMTRQVQHILLRFGILSTFRKKKTRCNGKVFENFENVVYGENVLKFINEIGFFGEKENREMAAVHEMASQIRNPNLDTVPKEIWEKFRVSNWKAMAREFGYAPKSFHNSRNYAPSREKLRRMAQFEKNDGIQMLATSEIYWDTIKEITEVHKETEVYDITVPGFHNFVANDIVVHNSYVLGVIAEELADKNKNVGIIVVDPIGVFWSMRFPNKEEKEIEKLKEWGLGTGGLNNLRVFIPEGVKGQVPKSTYDAGFAMQPSLLTGEDWALTFGVDRFSVSGLLLDKVLKKVEKGYSQIVESEPEETMVSVKRAKGKVQGQPGNAAEKPRHRPKERKIAGKGKDYSLEDLVECLETDTELNSREKGYKQDSIRAIISRFEAAKAWGIFSEKGTPLRELSKEGQLTILDTSFLEDNVTALVIGILSRRLLAARKISTRKEASSKFKSLTMDELLEIEVPPTWLFIDEAHTLIPSGNEVTAATAGLIEYVKQGRRPGLSLVFATQQPSAINTKVLSQLDVIMTHKLIFDDDIKAVFKRTPTIIPRRYRAPNFIKTLPVGVALTGDRREETSRAFVMAIRPRKSQHEGRDAETTGVSESIGQEQAEKVCREMLLRRVRENGFVDMDMARLAVETLNSKYGAKINPEAIIGSLAGSGIIVNSDGIMLEGWKGGRKAAKPKPEISGMAGDSNEETLEKAGEEDESGVEGTEEEEKEGSEAGNANVGTGGITGGRGTQHLAMGGENIASTELPALPCRIGETNAKAIVESLRQKKVLGLFGKSERIEAMRLKYITIWRVKFDAMTPHKEFVSGECFISSSTGELMHFRDGRFFESRGMRLLSGLGEEEGAVLKMLSKRKALAEEIMAQAGIDEAKAHRILSKLLEKKLVEKALDRNTGKAFYQAREKLDLPQNARHQLMGSIAQLPFVKADALSIEKETVGRDEAAESVRKLWNWVIIKRVEGLYKPVWHAVLESDGKARNVIIDAVNGKIISS